MLTSYPGNKQQHANNLRLAADTDQIVDPFFGAGGGLVPLILRYQPSSVITAETNPYNRALFDRALRGDTGLQSYVTELKQYVNTLLAQDTWAEVQAQFKQDWNQNYYHHCKNPTVGWLRSLGFSTFDRVSSKGLNTTLNMQKIVGNPVWQAACSLFGPKPEKHKAKIAYNAKVAEFIWQHPDYGAGASITTKIDNWAAAIAPTFRELGAWTGKARIYGDCYQIPIDGISDRAFLLLDPPYYNPARKQFTDDAGRKRYKKMHPAYANHLPGDLSTWHLCLYWLQIAEAQGIPCAVWNYGSPEYVHTITNLRAHYEHSVINENTCTPLCRSTSKYDNEPIGLESGYYFDFRSGRDRTPVGIPQATQPMVAAA
jgi:hypothetical protein